MRTAHVIQEPDVLLQQRDLSDQTKRAAYTMRGAYVELRERRNGEITIEYKKRSLDYTIYCEKEQQQGKVVEAKLLQQKRGPVPLSHPWRNFDFSDNSIRARAAANFASCASRDISTLRIWVTFQLWVYIRTKND